MQPRDESVQENGHNQLAMDSSTLTLATQH